MFTLAFFILVLFFKLRMLIKKQSLCKKNKKFSKISFKKTSVRDSHRSFFNSVFFLSCACSSKNKVSTQIFKNQKDFFWKSSFNKVFTPVVFSLNCFLWCACLLKDKVSTQKLKKISKIPFKKSWLRSSH